jgi:hypothetical protein
MGAVCEAAIKTQGLSQDTLQPAAIYNALQSPPIPTRPNQLFVNVLFN